MSTDHHLVSLWESVLKLLDKPGDCVSVLGVDFSKSFNRIDHSHCMRSLARLGASNQVLGLHAAFLSGRGMQVRVGSVTSARKPVFGGCVQGSLLGVMQHNMCLDSLDDGLEEVTSKYVDDMSLIEGLSTSESDNEGMIRAGKSEAAFKLIKERAEEVNMKVNTDKTTLLCIGNSREKVKTYIEDGNKRVTSVESLKLLGFHFSDSPTMGRHVEEIKKKVYNRSWTLVNLKRAGVEPRDILAVYYSIIRSVIEYASVTYHSMLTAEQSNALESLQRMCVRLIFGWDRSYELVRQEEQIELLKARREEKCLAFANKCIDHPTFKNWFPLEHDKGHSLRAVPKYAMPRFNFYRYDKSPLNFMRRLLNGEESRENITPLVARYQR